MGIATIATAIDKIVIRKLFRFEHTMLVKVESPKVVFQTESCFSILILEKLLPTLIHHPMVFFRRAASVAAISIWTIACESKNISFVIYYHVDKLRYLLVVPF